MNSQFFEKKFLKEDERTIEWIMDKLRPEESREDRIILQSITGYDQLREGEISETYQERRDHDYSLNSETVADVMSYGSEDEDDTTVR